MLSHLLDSLTEILSQFTLGNTTTATVFILQRENLVDHATELHIDANHITIGGDSSGGNLALATALSETCCGKIESLLLFYPLS